MEQERGQEERRSPAGVSVRASRLTKSYGSFEALGSGLDLHVPAGTFATLLGPSGSGKTTTLRCIAGLERPNGGRITIGDTVVFDGDGTYVPPQRRGLGMVFQAFAVWPHMTVAENVAYPLQIRGHEMGVSRAHIETTVNRTLELVGLSAYRDRYPNQLSGGQQQRVALARAVAGNPPLILFDEPLSNLDAHLREQMRTELRALHEQLGITALYVTHDQAEAMELSNLVFLMNEGQIVQSGTPTEVYERPTDIFACRLMGSANVWDVAEVGSPEADGTVTVRFREGFALRALPPRRQPPKHGAVRPHRLLLSAPGQGVPGLIEDVAFLGERVRYAVRVGTTQLRVDAFQGPRLHRGDTVGVSAPPDGVILI